MAVCAGDTNAWHSQIPESMSVPIGGSEFREARGGGGRWWTTGGTGGVGWKEEGPKCYLARECRKNHIHHRLAHFRHHTALRMTSTRRRTRTSSFD